MNRTVQLRVHLICVPGEGKSFAVPLVAIRGGAAPDTFSPSKIMSMNITLSADETLIAKARAYAQARNTTLNQLIRDYLERITGRLDGPEAAKEYAKLVRSKSRLARP